MVCHEMGWTWQEYEAQPSWFVDIVVGMLHAEGEYLKSKQSGN